MRKSRNTPQKITRKQRLSWEEFESSDQRILKPGRTVALFVKSVLEAFVPSAADAVEVVTGRVVLVDAVLILRRAPGTLE
jgi:hypothetical protein